MRKTSLISILILAAAALLVPVARAAETAAAPKAGGAASASDARRAQVLLARAVSFYKEKKEAALAAFSRPGEFMDGDLYVYALDTKGTMLASGGSSSALIGRDVSNLRDAAGNAFFREMLDKSAASGSGVVEYRWLNRVFNKIERKVTYFQKVDDRVIAVGYYIPRATPEQAAAMLERAAGAVKANANAAFASFNELRGAFIEDDLYVFVVGLDDGRFRAHGASPRLVGTDGNLLRDPNGKPVVKEMIAAVKDKDRGELDYAWRNPVTSSVENKHTLFRRVDGYLVGVGYYTR